MSKRGGRLLEKLTWKEVRGDVIKANPELSQAIDDFDPNDNFHVIKARYRFGQNILDHGSLFVPMEDGELVHIKDPRVDKSIREELAYAKTMPVGLVLNNSIELYLTQDKQIIPFSMMKKGKIFALWSALEIGQSAHTGKIWSITAGARSIFLLPKVSDTTCFKKVKKEFHLHSCAPRELLDQWAVFKEIVNHPSFTTEWYADVVFFGEEWLKKIDNPKQKLLRNFLLEKVWQDTAFLRNQVIFDFTFSCALASKNLKPNPFLADTVKHLYAIGNGSYPGFIFASDNSAAPIKELQKVFHEFYGLRYAPTIMHPNYYIQNDSSRSIYYSLKLPTLMSFSPKSRTMSSNLTDLKEIKHVMDGTLAFLLENKFNLESTPIYKLATDVNYSYYHSEQNLEDGIMHTSRMVSSDRILKSLLHQYSDLGFCENSSFLRGCICISSDINK